MREPVYFADTIDALCKEMGVPHFLEVSPHPVLIHSIRDCLSAHQDVSVPLGSLKRDVNDVDCMLDTLAELYRAGCDPAWPTLYPDGQCVHVPPYAWKHISYWLESDASKMLRLGDALSSVSVRSSTQHPVLGQKIDLPGQYWRNTVSSDHGNYPSDHCIQGHVVYPAAGYLDVCLAVAMQYAPSSQCVISDLYFHKALFLETDRSMDLHIGWDPEGKACAIYSRVDQTSDQWSMHASARISVEPGQSKTRSFEYSDLNGIFGAVTTPSRGPSAQGSTRLHCHKGKLELVPSGSDLIERSLDECYALFDKAGFNYGAGYRKLKSLCAMNQEAFGEIENEGGDVRIHPSALDAGLQLFLAAMAYESDTPELNTLYLPMKIGVVRFYGGVAQRLYAHARVTQMNDQYASGDVIYINEDNDVVLELKNVHCQALVQHTGAMQPTGFTSSVEWERKPFVNPVDSQNTQGWMVIDNDTALSHYLKHLGVDHLYGTLSEINDLAEQLANVQGVLYVCDVDNEYSSSCGVTASVLKLLDLVHLLCRQGKELPLGLNVITRGGQRVDASIVSEQGLFQSPVWGMMRVADNEHRELHVHLIDLPLEQTEKEWEVLWQVITDAESESEVAIRQNERYVTRVKPYTLSSNTDRLMQHVELGYDDPYRIEQHLSGRIDDMVVVRTQRADLLPDEIEIHVEAAGLNFKDVLKARGVLHASNYEANFQGAGFGVECAGVVSAVGASVRNLKPGDDVVAFASGSFGSYARTKALFALPKPKSWSAEQAASVPLACMTAWYSLCELAGLSKEDRVLIHSAAGGVGQAAIYMAKSIGATIFTTAGSEEKRAFLRSQDIPYVFDSRSTDFADQIMAITEGKGVDVVLNTLPGDLMRAGISAMSSFGRFVEIGKTDIDQGSMVNLDPFSKNLTFYSVDIDRLLFERPNYGSRLFSDMMMFLMDAESESGFERSDTFPIPYTTWLISSYKEAFKHMSSGQHMGKMVLEIKNQSVSVDQDAEFQIVADAWYLVTGGTSGFGLAVAGDLVRKGARHIMLLSRSGKVSDENTGALDRMREKGAEIRICKADTSSCGSMDTIFDEIRKQALPLKGIIHSATVYHDALIEEMTEEHMREVMGPKACGAWELHRLTQDMDLDFFVMFSSITSVIGNVGQANYAAANAFLDALAEFRRQQGLPALSVNWGAIADVGYVSRHLDVKRKLKNRGIGALSVQTVCDALWECLTHSVSRTIIADMKWDKVQLLSSGSPEKYAAVCHEGGRDAGVSVSGRTPELIALSEASVSDRMNVLNQIISTILAGVLGYALAEHINHDRGFFDMGLDSMLAADLTEQLDKAFECQLAATTTFRYPTVTSLAEFLAGHELSSYFDNAGEANDHIEKETHDETMVLLKQELDQLEKDGV